MIGRTNRGRGFKSALLGGAMALAMSVAPMASAQDIDRDEHFGHHGEAIRAELIAKTPDVYYGKTVLVEGSIDDMLGVGVFELEDDDMAIPGSAYMAERGDLIVVVPEPLRASLASLKLEDGMKVKVVGEVRKITITEVDDLGELDDDIDVDIERMPVMVATAIMIDD
jgi:hypothetical protein